MVRPGTDDGMLTAAEVPMFSPVFANTILANGKSITGLLFFVNATIQDVN